MSIHNLDKDPAMESKTCEKPEESKFFVGEGTNCVLGNVKSR